LAAGAKGYSLAIAIEVLTGVLAGFLAWDITSLSVLSEPQHVSHFVLAIDVKAFLPLEEYFSSIETLRSGIKNSKRAPVVDEIYLPGEIELMKQKKAGPNPLISLPESVILELNEVAQEVGMGPLAASA
jgi:L-2-hydroxycarboxylate dehydrogenase (NAD+)